MTQERTETGTDRLVKALRNPGHRFTSTQVAYLMATAGRWAGEVATYDLAHAYELGRAAAQREIAELNMDAIRAALDTPTFSAAQIEREDRQRAAREAAYGPDWLAPRPGDHPGGPVIEPGWGDEDEAW